MALLQPIRNRLHLIAKSFPHTTVQAVSVKTWNYGWKPGPIPKTKEEHEAAAKKYGLHPADYKPLVIEPYAYGDYPDLEPMYHEYRDPYRYYEDYKNVRHFGEPINELWETYQPQYQFGEPSLESTSALCMRFLKYTLVACLLLRCCRDLVQYPAMASVKLYRRRLDFYSYEFEDEDDAVYGQ